MASFASLGYRVRFVYYVRNLPQLWNSRYNQLVKAYAVSAGFDEFARRNTNRAVREGLSTHSLLKFLDDPATEWIVRLYDARVRAVGTERDFLDCIGLGDFPEGAAVVRSNESVGPVAVEAARCSMKELEADGVQLTRHQRGLCGRALKATLDAVAIKEPAYSGMTSPLARTIETTLQPLNDEFAGRVWGRSWAEVFGEDVGQDYTSNDLNDVSPSAAQQEALDAFAEVLRPRIRDIVTHGPLHET